MTIFDKLLMFFDQEPGGATVSPSIDKQSAGIDEPLDVYIGGAEMTAGTTIVVQHSPDDTTFTTAAQMMCTLEQLNEGFVFRLPPKMDRYITLQISDGAGGTMTAGICLDAQMSY